jgi:hypothetical protein
MPSIRMPWSKNAWCHYLFRNQLDIYMSWNGDDAFNLWLADSDASVRECSVAILHHVSSGPVEGLMAHRYAQLWFHCDLPRRVHDSLHSGDQQIRPVLLYVVATSGGHDPTAI